MDMIFRPSVSQNASWNTSTSTANTISTYPAFTSVTTTGTLADYCELEFNFRNNADSTSPDYIQDMIRSVTYRYSDSGSAIANEGLRTIRHI